MSRTEPQQGHHQRTSLAQETLTPSPSTHCFIAEQERAEHWLNLWANFWSPKRGWL